MEDSKENNDMLTIADAIEATAAELEKLNDTLNNWVDDTHDPIDDKYYEALKTRAVLNDHVLRWLVELRDIKNGNDAAKFDEAYIFYRCDHKIEKCKNSITCGGEDCNLTGDITHAVNFKRQEDYDGTVYFVEKANNDQSEV